MISLKCPHCKVGLKVDESKIPSGITSFKCPKCKAEIPLTYLADRPQKESDSETIVVSQQHQHQEAGRLTVLPDENTLQQEFSLHAGILVVGRKANVSTATISVPTEVKTMSSGHVRIDVKHTPSGACSHYLLAHIRNTQSVSKLMYS